MCSLFSLILLFLAPFMQWWLTFPENMYFYIIFNLFIFSNIFYLINFSGLLIQTASLINSEKLHFLAKYARLISLYGLFAPITAFIFASFYGKSDSYGVYFYFLKLSDWQKILLLMPIFYISVLADIMRDRIQKMRFYENKKEN